jgi:hypothetical protein
VWTLVPALTGKVILVANVSHENGRDSAGSVYVDAIWRVMKYKETGSKAKNDQKEKTCSDEYPRANPCMKA